jgi:hypothetical protein
MLAALPETSVQVKMRYVVCCMLRSVTLFENKQIIVWFLPPPDMSVSDYFCRFIFSRKRMITMIVCFCVVFNSIVISKRPP